MTSSLRRVTLTCGTLSSLGRDAPASTVAISRCFMSAGAQAHCVSTTSVRQSSTATSSSASCRACCAFCGVGAAGPASAVGWNDDCAAAAAVLLHYLLDDGWSPPGLGWQTNWQSLPRWAARRATCRHPRPRRRWVREGGCLAVLPLARSPPAGMSQRHPPAPPSWERCPRPPPQLPPTPAARQARRR